MLIQRYSRTLRRKHDRQKKRFAQVTVEFTFAMIAVALLIMGLIRVFTWSGKDLFERRRQHEAVLIEPVGIGRREPLRQTRPVFFSASEMGAAVNSSVFGDANP